ncbi:hypothetical protein E2562_019321, partial [Oryza meyeriana var. granulata]
KPYKTERHPSVAPEFKSEGAHLKRPAGGERGRGLTTANGPRRGAPSEGISGEGLERRRRRSSPASGAGGGAAARSRGV